MLRRFNILVLFCCLITGGLHAAESQWQGRAVGEFIEFLTTQGLKVIYSTDVVRDSFVVQVEPNSDEPLEALQDVLRPYGLIASAGPGNTWLIIKNGSVMKLDEPVVEERVSNQPLPEIVVSSSVYSVQYQKAGSHVFLDRDFIAGLPDVGEETLSALARLPGVANGGVSARSNVRGGVANEQLVIFDGLRLYEPYHLKDFHTVASTIDQSAVDSMDFYTAGYQVRYGDRMSSVVDIGMRAPPENLETELGLSFFNAWGLSTGRFGKSKKGDWLVSARRSNLDVLARTLNPDLGSPRFFDTLAHIGWQWKNNSYISANYLYSYDDVVLAQEDDSEEARALYRNRIAWLKMETDWSSNLSSSTVLSATDISNRRSGESDLPDVLRGTVDDSRDFSSYALTTDWDLSLSDTWIIKAGLDVKFLDADYDYASVLQIFSPFDQILDNESFSQTDITLSPTGEQFAVYVEARWQATENLVLDLGFRWDRQTYSGSDNNEQRSPRLNALYKVNDQTELRVGVGRFYQAQEINELQVSDGSTSYFAPQFADHIVASLVHHMTPGLSFRAEFYQKDYGDPIPRFENVFNSLVIIPELQIDRARIEAQTSLVQGVELTIAGTDDDLSWWASYVWSTVQDKVAGSDERRSWDQRNSVTAGISGQWGSWDLSVAGTWHSGWPKTELLVESIDLPNGSTELIATTTPRNSLNYDDFHSLDIRASRIFRLTKGELEVFLEISNLSNRENQCCTQYTVETGENGESTIRATKEHWLPLIPSLGVIWRF